jgi:hypothetical protein
VPPPLQLNLDFITFALRAYSSLLSSGHSFRPVGDTECDYIDATASSPTMGE